MTPAANRPLRAFAAAFRRLNEAALHSAIAASGIRPDDDAITIEDIATDIAVQVHFGERVPVRGPFTSLGRSAGWHVDHFNSALHLSLTLGGRRQLCFSSAAKRDPDSDGDEPTLHSIDLTSGSAYITAPATFPHAVQYEQCQWGEHIIAVQMRVHLSERGEGAVFDAGSRFLRAFVELIAEGGLVLPTEDHVREAARSIA